MVDTATPLVPPSPEGQEYPPPPGAPPPVSAQRPPWYRRQRRWLAILAAVVIVAGVIVAISLGGGSSGNGKAQASWLPKPAAGMATIGGKLTVNGAPRANEDVSLLVNGKSKVKVQTSTDGAFVFQSVAPGTYSLMTTVWVPNVRVSGPGGLASMDWDKPCSAPGFDVLNLPGTSRTTGESGVIAGADNSGGTGHHSRPFTVSAGDRYAQNVTLTCAR